MIDKLKLQEWLNARIKDEKAGLELISGYPFARAVTTGSLEAYSNVLGHLENMDD